VRIQVAGTLLLLGLAAGSLPGQVTEGTVPSARGQWTIESDLAWHAVDHWTPARDDVHFTETGGLAVLASYGLSETADVQVGWNGWTTASSRGPGVTERIEGAGDIIARAKWNFAGDESTGSAWAVLPYIKIPTAADPVRNGAWEPGVALVQGMPWGAAGWFNAMLAIDALEDDTGRRTTAGFASAVAGTSIGDGVDAYAELVAEWDYDGGAPAITGGVGFAWAASETLVFDVQALVGLNRSAVDWMPVLRLVWTP